MCIAVFTLDAGLLARSQYSEGPATGHLDTEFSWFPCVYKQMLRWFPRVQVGDVNSSSTCRCAHSLRKIQERFKNFGRLKIYKSLTEDPQL